MAAGRGQGEQLLPVLVERADGGAGGGRRPLGVAALVQHPAGVLIVVEDAPHAPGLAPVLQEEVFIAPGLEHLVVGGIHAIAGPLEGAMEVAGILEEGVVGRQVGAAAEPPHGPGLEVAVVEVDRGHVGIAGVQHHRGAGGEPALPLRLGPLGQDRRRQAIPLHLGEVDPALLEHPALLHHPGAAAASLRPLPALLLEAPLPVEVLEARTDRILQAHQQDPGPAAGIGGGHLHGAAARWTRNIGSPFQPAGGPHKGSRASVMGRWRPGRAPSRGRPPPGAAPRIAIRIHS